jgi:hypothetical protein
MFTKTQLNNMNYDMRFSSSPWITIIESKNTDKEKDELYKLYHDIMIKKIVIT